MSEPVIPFPQPKSRFGRFRNIVAELMLMVAVNWIGTKEFRNNYNAGD